MTPGIPPHLLPYNMRLNAARRHVERIRAANARPPRELTPADTAHVDQIRAAARAAEQMVNEHGPRVLRQAGSQDVRQLAVSKTGPELTARFLASMLGCAECPHLQGHPAISPAVSVMSPRHRFHGCEPCFRRRPLVDYIPDDVCDLCEQTIPSREFVPVIVQWGSAVVIADVCASCRVMVSEGAP